MSEQQTVSLADAKRVIEAGEAKATEIGQPMNIAVVDAGGNLVAHEFAELSQSGDQLFGIHASNNGRVMIFAGGIPLKRDGQVVGAIGVSGVIGKQDQAVAEAGEAAF